ncbi:FAD-dependent oxidoreductase [Sinorhizobium americanum]|uniref:FAD-dependent oxidoreductase n=1 Tax=Sinorhizobium americanum TaxID=194963 RepID=UPI00399A6225
MGVDFRYDTTVKTLDVEVGQVNGVVTSHGTLACDAVIVALGSYTPLLLRPFGIRLPVYPVKGYSLTIPITDQRGPRNPRSWTKPTRSPSRVWATVSALAIWVRFPATPMTSAVPADARRTLEHSVMDLFPRRRCQQGSLLVGS